MARLSHNKLYSASSIKRPEKFIPFTAFIRITPIASDKRMEIIRDIEEIANKVEDDIKELYTNNTIVNVLFDHAHPVKYTPQFGDKTARITIHGNYRSDISSNYTSNDSFVKQHKEDRLVIQGGEFKTGYGAHNAAFQETSDKFETAVLEIMDVLSEDLNLTPYRLEISGIIYGIGGRHFPK